MYGDNERDAHVLALLRAVRGFGDAHDRMSGGMKHGMGMNASDLAALRLLIIRAEEGSPVSPRDLSAHLRISTASTTKLLDRLTDSGHVRRAPHPSDRRARVIELTDAARQDFFRLFGPQLAAMRQAMAPFSEAELEIAERVFRAMGAAIDPETSPRPAPAAT
ncbi:MarR family winged helix-turn-helix transcriptional regulator [Leucobacter sp. NPDC058333]|uniref:MarR family winged helix-turn-helix transcriptional regulator n=1 Tax=Leucobacter sp. NPDC058333 TaxID=3346450 RepID=UPI00364CD842